ncbi:hypothetical protein HYS47_02450 [Candidatus Woesearchaeota archaeon]|nr:hypothetical protein [Candidatus Woesearchaeota archaeon]
MDKKVPAKAPSSMYEEERQEDIEEKDEKISVGMWIGAAVFLISVILGIALIITYFSGRV